MKKSLLIFLCLILLSSLSLAQSASTTTRRIFSGASDPATCQPSGRNVFLNTTTDELKICSATNTWTAVGGGSIAIGTTTITGGTNTRVLFDDAGVIGEDAGFTYAKASDTLTLLGGLVVTQGSIAASTPHISQTATWNNAGVTFINQLVNVTDTASAAGSQFLNFQVAGNQRFGVAKTGALTLGEAGTNTASLNIVGSAATAQFIMENASGTLRLNNVDLDLAGGSNGLRFSASFDFGLNRVAAAVGKVTDGGGNLGWLQWAGQAFVTGNQTNATTTFQTTTLSATVVSGRKYTGRLVIHLTESTAAEGFKLDFNGGTATATDFRAQCHLINDVGATLTQTAATTTTLAGVINIGATTNANQHRYECTFSFEPSANGTFIPRFAQNTHTTGTATVLRGSHMVLYDMP